MYKYLLYLLLLLPAPGCLSAQDFQKGFSYGCNLNRKLIVSPAKYRNDSLTCTAEYKWSEYTTRCVILHTGHIVIDGQKFPFKRLKVQKSGYIGSWKYLTNYEKVDTFRTQFQSVLGLVKEPNPDGSKTVVLIWADRVSSTPEWTTFHHCRVGVVGTGRGFVQRRKYVCPKSWVELPPSLGKTWGEN
jgi:hypothetical protein